MTEQCMFGGSRSCVGEGFSEEVILNRCPHEVRETAEGRLGWGKSDFEGGDARAKAGTGWK